MSDENLIELLQQQQTRLNWLELRVDALERAEGHGLTTREAQEQLENSLKEFRRLNETMG